MQNKRVTTDEKGMLAVKIIASACKELPAEEIDVISQAKKVCEKKEKLFIKTLSEEQKALYDDLNFARKDYHEKFLSAAYSNYCSIKG